MRTIEVKVFKFNELPENIQQVVINNEIEFYINNCNNEHDAFYKEAMEMEANKTPWFLPELIWKRGKDFILDSIKENDYEYYENGKIY